MRASPLKPKPSMRTLFALAVFLSLTRICAAAEFKPFDGPKPIAIFIQSNPWERPIGSDTPTVAVYENGEVIFEKKVNGRPIYHSVTLDEGGLDKLRRRIEPVLALRNLKPWYIVEPYATDQPGAEF